MIPFPLSNHFLFSSCLLLSISLCMTFRHRHLERGDLIETAEFLEERLLGDEGGSRGANA
jgi:hypothetical protein